MLDNMCHIFFSIILSKKILNLKIKIAKRLALAGNVQLKIEYAYCVGLHIVIRKVSS